MGWPLPRGVVPMGEACSPLALVCAGEGFGSGDEIEHMGATRPLSC